MAYNYNPAPQSGQNNPFGAIPGTIDLPDPYGDLNTAMGGGLGTLNSSIFGNLQSMANGQVPQADQNFIQDQAAGTAAASGMPGTNAIRGTLGGNQSARNLGLLQYQLQQQAAQLYPSLTGSVAQNQTVSPALQAQIAGTNTSNAALANPTIAGTYAQNLLQSMMQQMRGPGGGTGGRGGSLDPSQSLQQSANSFENSPYEQDLNRQLAQAYGDRSGSSYPSTNSTGNTYPGASDANYWAQFGVDEYGNSLNDPYAGMEFSQEYAGSDW